MTLPIDRLGRLARFLTSRLSDERGAPAVGRALNRALSCALSGGVGVAPLCELDALLVQRRELGRGVLRTASHQLHGHVHVRRRVRDKEPPRETLSTTPSRER